MVLAVPVILVALPNASRHASSSIFVLALGVLLLGVLITVGGLWIRRTESILTILVVLLLLVPQNYVLVGPLRSVGNPALLWSLFALLLWCGSRLLGLVMPPANNPMRWGVFFYLIAATLAFASGMARPLTDVEASGATRAIFPALAVVGVALVACDGLTQRGQVERVLQRLVYVAGLAGVAGIFEFFDRTFSYRTLAHLPGLTTNTELINDTRSGFVRVIGAAAHPIEYAVALACLVPIALHFTLHGASRGSRQGSALSLGIMLAVIPMSVSRSGIVALLVAGLWYGAHLRGRQRLNLVLVGIVGAGAMSAVAPRLLGTIRSLMFIGEDDPSIRGRTSDYVKIPWLLQGHEVTGRGLGTFQPAQYFFLDNAYLGALLEGGAVALAALVLLFLVGVLMAQRTRRNSVEPSVRSLCQALSAAILALAATAATFDMTSFRQTGFLLFLFLGCVGALWAREGRLGKGKKAEPPQTVDIPRAASNEVWQPS
ncbi:O-antigen ligase family protein [Intrasporangium chromatireducens]|uniref:O-antigen ligase family protein n=1 Tax=Intrasporangium chromatireducens TaxID=1386088 RepID=UPI0012DC2B5D|nr:O-antigen ligase family protein [Intrasporangium chromatireducens]